MTQLGYRTQCAYCAFTLDSMFAKFYLRDLAHYSFSLDTLGSVCGAAYCLKHSSANLLCLSSSITELGGVLRYASRLELKYVKILHVATIFPPLFLHTDISSGTVRKRNTIFDNKIPFLKYLPDELTF